MTTENFHGLLECPYHKGWIEFSYQDGDKISDLSASIENKWGSLKRDDDRLFSFNAGSWAFFCAQKDGSYLALRKNDPIPTEPPTFKKQHITNHYGHQPFFPRHPEILDLSFLDEKFWKGHRNKSVEIVENFSIDLPFERRYRIPEENPYDARLLALVAIVGG
jgi:hypothetical protein